MTRGSAGFTLLEMLIALTILALGSAFLLQNVWAGTWGARQAWDEVSALRLAESVASEAGVAFPVPPEGLYLTEPGVPLAIEVRQAGTGLPQGFLRIDVRGPLPSTQLLASITRKAGDAR